MSVAELEELQINLLRDSLEEELKEFEKKQTVQESHEDS
tara:strand:- start:568 stop:684 length:117 start_codon:yes stop_codon:yes gene_type:complete